jgi:hypothetical protein
LNILAVKHTKIEDSIGEITFVSQNQNEIKAFFYGSQEIFPASVNVEFCWIDYPLNWDIIFNENRAKVKTLIREKGHCSYQAYGQIISIEPTIADFGDIKMEIGLHSSDHKIIGEFIYWKIDRLDILTISSA